MASNLVRKAIEDELRNQYPNVSFDTIFILFQATWNELNRINMRNKRKA
jgi:hypothetical protein